MSKFSNTILKHTAQGTRIEIVGVRLDTPQKQVLAKNGLFPTLIVNIRTDSEETCNKAAKELFLCSFDSPEFEGMCPDLINAKQRRPNSCYKASISFTTTK
jgi:hypothetical protein